MIRNLDRRVEVAAPVHDPELKKRVVEEVLDTAFADNVKARRVLSNGQFERIKRAADATPYRSQQVLLEMAMKQPEPVGDSGLSEPQKRRNDKKKKRR
jgi:polyphosphate kinase